MLEKKVHGYSMMTNATFTVNEGLHIIMLKDVFWKLFYYYNAAIGS